jgi:hypothetical protein
MSLRIADEFVVESHLAGLGNAVLGSRGRGHHCVGCIEINFITGFYGSRLCQGPLDPYDCSGRRLVVVIGGCLSCGLLLVHGVIAYCASYQRAVEPSDNCPFGLRAFTSNQCPTHRPGQRPDSGARRRTLMLSRNGGTSGYPQNEHHESQYRYDAQHQLFHLHQVPPAKPDVSDCHQLVDRIDRDADFVVLGLHEGQHLSRSAAA